MLIGIIAKHKCQTKIRIIDLDGTYMPLFKEEYKKEEKINGVIYDMLPSQNYQHGMKWRKFTAREWKAVKNAVN